MCISCSVENSRVMDGRPTGRFTSYDSMSESYPDYQWSPVPDDQPEYPHDRRYPPSPPHQPEPYHDGPNNPFDDPFFQNFLKGNNIVLYEHSGLIIGFSTISTSRASQKTTSWDNINHHGLTFQYQRTARCPRPPPPPQHSATSPSCPRPAATTTATATTTDCQGQTKTPLRSGYKE